MKLCILDNLRKMSKTVEYILDPRLLCCAATSPWCCSRDHGVVQEIKGFLTPTTLLLCIQIFYLAKNTIFKCNNNYHAHIKLRQQHRFKSTDFTDYNEKNVIKGVKYYPGNTYSKSQRINIKASLDKYWLYFFLSHLYNNMKDSRSREKQSFWVHQTADIDKWICKKYRI